MASVFLTLSSGGGGGFLACVVLLVALVCLCSHVL